MDGYLKIKTKLDNSDVDKGVIELENKIKKLQLDNASLSKEERKLQKAIDKYKELTENVENYKRQMESLQYIDKNGVIQVRDKKQMLNLQAMYSTANAELQKQAPKIDNIYMRLNKVKSKQIENNAKIEQYKQKIEQINVNKVQQGIDNVGKKIQSSIGKLGKMSMAIIGIKTAFNAVRQAVSAVSQYNPQISADFEYMRYCIANLLAPVIQRIVQLLYTALSYINAIANAWFGINLFGNSSVKNFQKMQKSASGTAKSAKEIQKSLQGFDEMNILQDGSTSKNAGTGISTPSMDLSGIQGEVLGWLEWIMDNRDLILGILTGIASGILAIKFGLGGIKSLGIGVMVFGIIKTILSLINYLKDPSWENFGKIIQSIGIAIVGLGILIGNVPLIVIGAIVLIVGTIVKYWEQIKNFLQSGIDWLTSKSDWVHEMFGDVIGDIYDKFIECLKGILDAFDGLFTGVKQVLDGIIKVFRGIFTGDMPLVLEGFKQVFKGIFDALVRYSKISS